VKVFALTFALGVVSGITMSFQFGTNWPGFMNTVGNVAGPLLAYDLNFNPCSTTVSGYLIG